MNQNTKRLVLLNLPYVLMGLYATNLGYAWRLAVGADFSEKMMAAGGLPERQERQEVPPRQRVRLGPLGQCQGHRAVCGPQV